MAAPRINDVANLAEAPVSDARLPKVSSFCAMFCTTYTIRTHTMYVIMQLCCTITMTSIQLLCNMFYSSQCNICYTVHSAKCCLVHSVLCCTVHSAIYVALQKLWRHALLWSTESPALAFRALTQAQAIHRFCQCVSGQNNFVCPLSRVKKWCLAYQPAEVSWDT